MQPLTSPSRKVRRPWLILLALLLATPPVLADSNIFCGGAAKPGDPNDLANVVGDQTLEYAAQQPASMMTCARGYLFEKCGDHETAHKVFDKCIAAGYVGAMIWKALMLEDGAGTEPNPAEAARLMQRAATSGDPGYAPLGKLHYASMLLQGKGVAKDEAEARRWFESAAADGNADAIAFLRDGYHTAARDQRTLGTGSAPASSFAKLNGDNASIARAPDPNAAPKPIADAAPRLLAAAPALPAPHHGASLAQARKVSLSNSVSPPLAAPAASPAPPANPPVTEKAPAQRLVAQTVTPPPGSSPWALAALAACLLIGAWLQGRRLHKSAPQHTA